MDDHKQDDDNQPKPPTGRFMDIQSPNNDNTSKSDQPLPAGNVLPTDDPTEQPPQSETTSTEPTEDSNSSDDTVDTSASEPAPGQSDQPIPTPGPEQIISGQHDHKHQGIPTVALVIAIIVTLALSGLVVYSYLKANKDSKIGTPSSSTEQPTTQSVTSTEVDATSTEIDKSLDAVNDSTDFPEASLSDTTLGL